MTARTRKLVTLALVAVALIEIPGALAVYCRSEDGVSLEIGLGGKCAPGGTLLRSAQGSTQSGQEAPCGENCSDVPAGKSNLYRPSSHKNTNNEPTATNSLPNQTVRDQDSLRQLNPAGPLVTTSPLLALRTTILLI